MRRCGGCNRELRSSSFDTPDGVCNQCYGIATKWRILQSTGERQTQIFPNHIDERIYRENNSKLERLGILSGSGCKICAVRKGYEYMEVDGVCRRCMYGMLGIARSQHKAMMYDYGREVDLSGIIEQDLVCAALYLREYSDDVSVIDIHALDEFKHPLTGASLVVVTLNRTHDRALCGWAVDGDIRVGGRDALYDAVCGYDAVRTRYRLRSMARKGRILYQARMRAEQRKICAAQNSREGAIGEN